MTTAHQPNRKSKIENQKSLLPAPYSLLPRRRRRSRGVVLLLVVSLLALFILLGVTFTIVALQALNASKLEVKIEQTGDRPETEMDLILGQILYDTNARSVLQYHSLLRDLYGYDGVDPVAGANHENTLTQATFTPQPQFRESFKGTVIPTTNVSATVITSDVFPAGIQTNAITAAGGQLNSFLFAIGPFSFNYPIAMPRIQASQLPTDAMSTFSGQPRMQALTALSAIPNYYVGRVITFTSGPAANHSARIVAYNPIPNHSQHIPLGTAQPLVNGTNVTYFPPYGQFAIELIESKKGGLVAPGPGDTFVVNGAPFNGAGAGFDPQTGNLNAAVASRFDIQNALGVPGPLFSGGPPQPPLNEYVALLPNYASYDAASHRVVFYPTLPSGAADPTAANFASYAVNASNPPSPRWIDPISFTGNKARSPNAMAIGGMDESWDAPDFQNMFLAMVPPRVAERTLDNDPTNTSTYGNDLPVIPSFHRPELINYWFNWVRVNIFESASLSHNITNPQEQAFIFLFPYGVDGVPGSGDEGTFGNPQTLFPYERDRIHKISRGCMFRPLPGDHPNFSGSNMNVAGATPLERAYSLLQILLGKNATGAIDNQNLFDIDNDGDGVADSVWIDPGLPIITMPDGRRVKRMASILIKDQDGLINVNAHGNMAQVYTPNGTTYPYLATEQPQPAMISSDYLRVRAPTDSVTGQPVHTHSVGMALQSQLLPRGIGFGPAEVSFANIFGGNPVAYRDVLATRYESSRFTHPYMAPDGTVMPTVTVLDNATLFDSPTTGIKRTGLPFATPGLPYYRDYLSVIKLGGIPNDYGSQASMLNAALQPSSYASPPDVWGRGFVTLDIGGQPLFGLMGGGMIPVPAGGGYYRTVTGQLPEELVDSPYEMLLNDKDNGTDSPYTPYELERLLRYHDNSAIDLPSRLLERAAAVVAPGYPRYPLPVYHPVSDPAGSQPPGVIGPAQSARNMLTTVSSHLPVPAFRPQQEIRQTNMALNGMPPMGSASILDLYRAKLIAGTVLPANIDFEMQKIVPWEFFKGQKFDINRWLGDGLDNNGNGSRDDLGDLIAPLTSPPNREVAFQDDDPNNDGVRDVPNFTLPASFATNIRPAHTNGLGMSDGYAARQAYARHLFCLAMLFLPDDLENNQPYLPDFSAYDPEANTPVNNRKLMVRRIAQWAINCVDFRDHDSAMTPFEFDYNPWNGWSVDGYIGRSPGPDGGWGVKGVDDNGNGVIDEPAEFNTNNSLAVFNRDVDAPGDDASAERGLVWGIEAPDLLITETLAFHDRGVKDTRFDDDPDPTNGKKKITDTPPDNDLDQFRIPKGSVFVELYSPRPTLWTGEPANFKPPTGAMDLAALAPPDNSSNRRPIWRLAFSKLKKEEDDPANPVNPAARALTHPESLGIDPIVYDMANGIWYANVNSLSTGATERLEINRFTYFTNNFASIPANEASYSFYNSGNYAASIAPGQYAVVAPRPLTYLGSQNPTNATPPPPANSLWGGNSPQNIFVLNNSVVVRNTAGTQTSAQQGTDSRQPVGIVCDMAGAGGMAWNVGMNISEPLPNLGSIPYYPVPSGLPSDTANPPTPPASGPGPRATDADFYGDPDNPSGASFPDEPIESLTNTVVNNTRWPIVENEMQNTGTYSNCSSVLLQRIADATLPYNPLPGDAAHDPTLPVNPYLTVDWSSLELTVFNGEEDVTNSSYSAQDIRLTTAPEYELRFRSRQRGFLTTGGGMSSNPWPPITTNTATTPLPTPTGATYFGIDLANRRINPAVEIPATMTTPRVPPYSYGSPPFVLDPVNDTHTLGSLNSTVDFPHFSTVNPNYYGEPIVPFPWLTWNKRPFANAMELLLVPSSSAERLALEMTPDFPVLPGSSLNPPAANANPYSFSQTGPPIDYTWHWPFGHMLNHFHDSLIDTSTTPANAWASAQRAPHFFRLLEYVEAPSPFVGTERWYNPNNFLGVGLYQPPFNKLSRFRDPGRININTIFDSDIWDALVSQFPGLRGSDNFAQQLFLSRQGYGTGAAQVLQMDANYPSRFSNPFRSADSSDLMPPGVLQKQAPIAATLLRSDPTATTQPLFQINANNALVGQWNGSGGLPGRTSGAGRPGSPANAHDINRNPYFRYQPLQKIGNIVSTNSNCFAIWITIGYFEVEEHKYPAGTPLAGVQIFDAAHPDGFSIGQEIGFDTGEVVRHRAFYIVDRSIPVGFIPGSRLNTDDCVLLKRLIE